MKERAGGWSLRLVGAVLLLAAAMHVAALFSGPGLIAALGAPEDVVASAARGTWLAPMVISAIAIILLLVGMAAFSTAGSIRPLPLSRPLLYLTVGVLLLRAAALPILLAIVPALRTQLSPFEVMTALLCSVLGGLLWLGLRGTRIPTAV